MTRVLEFVVALIMVIVLAVIVGLFLPSHAHIERSIDISHNPQHIYDALNNFRRFKDVAGAGLVVDDNDLKSDVSGPAYGPGATVSWQGNAAVGNGSLVNKSATIDLAKNAKVVWGLTNDWHGHDKTFTITLTPKDGQRVSTVTWSYDVDYGWNLIGRYSALWIHGAPSQMIRYGLDSLQTMMAAIDNIGYDKLDPAIYKVPATPMLLVSTKAKRSMDDIDAAKAAAYRELQAAMAKLGVKQAGPTTTITTNYGAETYVFDVAVPIDATTLTIAGQSHDLTQLPAAPTAAELMAQPETSAPASSAPTDVVPALPAGSLDKQNQLVVDANVRAVMRPAQEVLEASWTGEVGLAAIRKALKAYATTHGYAFDPNAHRIYAELFSLPSVADEDQAFRVYLPVQDAPAQTPEQQAGRSPQLTAPDPSLWAGAAVAPPAAAEPPKEAKKAEPRKRPVRHERRRRG